MCTSQHTTICTFCTPVCKHTTGKLLPVLPSLFSSFHSMLMFLYWWFKSSTGMRTLIVHNHYMVFVTRLEIFSWDMPKCDCSSTKTQTPLTMNCWTVWTFTTLSFPQGCGSLNLPCVFGNIHGLFEHLPYSEDTWTVYPPVHNHPQVHVGGHGLFSP